VNAAHLLRATAATLAFVIVLSVRVWCAGPPLEPQSSCANVTRDFVRSDAPRNDRYLDFFRACGNMESLELLMSGLAKTNGPRDPLELFAAIDATLNSPTLRNNTEATALLARTVPTIPDARLRAIFAQMLGRRGANAALLALLQHDPSAGVRAAATEALAQSSTPFDDAILFEVARNDKDAGVRAKAWLALEHLNRLHDRTDRLIALNAQRDGDAIVRLFDAWLASGKASSPSAYATQLVELARNGSVNQAIGALAAITAILDADSAAMPLVRQVPMPPAPKAPAASAPDAAPAASQVRRALETQRDRIAGAALKRFAQSAALDEAAARIALSALAAAYGCERAQCAAAPPHPARHGPPAVPARY
jgi:HEAT repeat protein